MQKSATFVALLMTSKIFAQEATRSSIHEPSLKSTNRVISITSNDHHFTDKHRRLCFTNYTHCEVGSTSVEMYPLFHKVMCKARLEALHFLIHNFKFSNITRSHSYFTMYTTSAVALHSLKCLWGARLR